MVRKVLMMESRSDSRRMPSWQAAGTPLATLLLVCGAVMLPVRHARAAMNFCAAPALQTSERTNADPGVKALVSNV